MKILQVAPGYYPRIGGLEYVVKSVSERLVKFGHEVTVLAGEPDVDKIREEEVNGVRVIRWPTWSPSEAYHFPRKKIDLEEILKELARQVDVVHVHSVYSVFAVHSNLLIASGIGSIKVVVTPHYHGTERSFIRRVLWIPWRRRVAELLKRASVVHADSRREPSILASHYPVARDKIVVIPNGVDEDVFDYRWRGQNSYCMIYAGRTEKYKRLELAIEVARELNLKLLIVGKGSYRDKLIGYTNKV